MIRSVEELAIGVSRRVPRPGAPRRTLIVTSRGPVARLSAILESPPLDWEADGAEIVVVRPATTQEIARLQGRYPRVRFVQAPVDWSTARLRNLGLLYAAGDVVRLVDDRLGAEVDDEP